jgi:hypothetical protein
LIGGEISIVGSHSDLIRQLLGLEGGAMTRRIISYPVELTATLLVAALPGSTAWASVSPIPTSTVHAQIQLVAMPEGGSEPDSGSDSGMNSGDGMDSGKSDSGKSDSGKSDSGKSDGENEGDSTALCERGFHLMTIDAMLRSVAAPGTAGKLKAEDANSDDHLCVKLAADGRSMTSFVDNNRAV